MKYAISFDDAVYADLDAISDEATRAVIIKRALELNTSPDLQGKALTGGLKGYRSVRAAGQRYRIIYRVLKLDGAVHVVLVGIRRDGHRTDAYEIADKRLV